ncbi:MAG: DoxX family protein [Reichenbachiella sp.]|uniref:DoxX family protein n=1 Tax=Reichenbachiella sp. TaxID=2184521 RepID=UPI0032646964
MMLTKLIQTDDNWSYLVARVTLALVIFPHGAQKILAIWGGHGLSATMEAFSQWFGIPPLVTFLVSCAEFFGMIALLLGLCSRMMAGSLILVMLGAIYFVVNDHFFMNWYSENRGEGFEFHLLVIGLCIILLIGGSGRLSIDRLLIKKASLKS